RPPAPARRRAAWCRRLGRSSFPYPRRDLVGLLLRRGRRLPRDVALGEPGHHLAALPPDLLDRLLLLLRAPGVTGRLSGAVLADPASEHDRLAEPVGLDLFLERRLDDAGARRAHALGIRERGLLGLARAVLVHREERGDALALLEDLAHAVARRLRRDHHDVGVGARLHFAELDREGVRDEERAA